MNTESNLLNNSAVQKSWPAGVDKSMDEDLELLSVFKGEPEVDNATKALKTKRLAKALDKPKTYWRARDFQLTLNQVERFEKLKNYLLSLKNLNYMIACQEKAPSTEHPHIHIYAQFGGNGSQKLATSKLEGAHVEECYASPQKNVDYIYKRGDYAKKKHNPNDEANIIFEYGEIRESGGAPKTIGELKTCAEADLDKADIQHYSAVKQELIRRRSIIKVKDWYCPKEIYYIHGGSGSGKTRFCTWKMEQEGVEEFENLKRDGDFFHGAIGELEVALYDDFRDSHMKPSEFIHLIDYNSHPLNVKYGSIVNHYKKIFITSVQSPRDLWNKMEARDEPQKQWLRRINHCIYLTEDHRAVEEDPFTGETIKEIKEFNILNLLNEIN